MTVKANLWIWKFGIIISLVGLLLLSGCVSPAEDETTPSNQETEQVDTLQTTQQPDQAMLANIAGTVEVASVDGGAWQAVEVNQVLSAGSVVRTGATSHAWLSFPDDSKAFLGPNTELKIVAINLLPESGAPLIELEQHIGETRHIVVNSGAKQTSYQVNTANTTNIAPQEGIFAVYVSAEQITQVTVNEGLVNASAAGQTQTLTTGRAVAIPVGQVPQQAAYVVTSKGTVAQTGEAWTISGQQFVIDEETMMLDVIQAGAKVYVEAHNAADGSLVADVVKLDTTETILYQTSLQAQTTMTGSVEVPTCTAVTAVVTAIEGDIITLHDGTTLNLAEVGEVLGEIEVYSLIVITTCVDDNGTIVQLTIIVLEEPIVIPGPTQQVAVCHIPPGNPANAHTIIIDQFDLFDHWGHGDYLGPCLVGTIPITIPIPIDDVIPQKAIICHIPPGNPAKAHTISIGQPAVQAHLGHGDVLGPCPEVEGQGNKGSNNGQGKDKDKGNNGNGNGNGNNGNGNGNGNNGNGNGNGNGKKK